MMTPWDRRQRRLSELLADRAVFGLSAEEMAELRELLPNDSGDDCDAMDRTAAVCCLGLGIQVADPLPPSLRDRIKSDAKHASSVSQ